MIYAQELHMTTRFRRDECQRIAAAVAGQDWLKPFVTAMVKAGCYEPDEIAERATALVAMKA